MTEKITADSFDQLVSEASNVLLVDVWAPWCAPCRALLPLLEKVAATFSSELTLLTLNADEYPQLVERLAVRTLPTVLLIKHGNELDRLTGVQSESQLLGFITPYIAEPPSDLLLQAEACRQQGLDEEALRLWQVAIADDPGNNSARIALIRALLEGGSDQAGVDEDIEQRLALALECLQQAPAECLRDPKLAQLQTRVRRAARLSEEARDWQQIAQRAQQGDLQAIELYSHWLAAGGRFDEAGEFLLQRLVQATDQAAQLVIRDELIALLDTMPDRAQANALRRRMFALTDPRGSE